MPIIIDPKDKNFEPFRGANLLTPNLSEFEAVVGDCNSEDELINQANHLHHEFDLDALLIMHSEQGMSLFVANHPPMRLPTQAREVFFVTGAGDTVAEVIGAGLAAAVMLANNAAGIVVSKMGTVGVTLGELQRAVKPNT